MIDLKEFFPTPKTDDPAKAARYELLRQRFIRVAEMIQRQCPSEDINAQTALAGLRMSYMATCHAVAADEREVKLEAGVPETEPSGEVGPAETDAWRQLGTKDESNAPQRPSVNPFDTHASPEEIEAHRKQSQKTM